MSDTPETPPAAAASATALTKLLDDTEAFFRRITTSTRAAQPVTNGTLANFILNTYLPTMKAIRAEYNEGFEAVGEELENIGGGDDDDTALEDAHALVVAGRTLVGELAFFANLLLGELKWLDPATGQLSAAAPASIREAFDAIFAKITAFEAAAKDVTVEETDGDDDEDDEDGDFTEEERNWQPGGGA